MEENKGRILFFFWCLASATALLSPKGVNFEGRALLAYFYLQSILVVKREVHPFFVLSYSVQALMDIKASFKDPHGVLRNWDRDSVDPCSWSMVSCSPENLVIGL